MKNLENLFNTKKGKIVAWLCILLVAVLAVVLVVGSKLIQKRENNLEDNQIEVGTKIEEPIDTGESGGEDQFVESGDSSGDDELVDTGETNEEETPIEYEKLSEDSFTIDKESNTISFDEDLNISQFVLSDSENGPTEEDEWHSIGEGQEEVELTNSEIIKKYTYYMASGMYKVGNSTYATLKDAVSHCSNGGTIELLKSDTDTSEVTISGKSITLNTNSYSINKGQHGITVASGATLTVTGNGTITTPSSNTKVQTTILVRGTLNVEGGTIENKGFQGSHWFGIMAIGGTVNIKGGTIRTIKSSDMPAGNQYGGRSINLRKGAICNVTGGLIETNIFGSFAIEAHAGSDTEGNVTGSINIEGGTMRSTGTQGRAIEIYETTGYSVTANINIKGGTIDGYDYGVYSNCVKAITIGTSGGGVSTSNPIITSNNIGVYAEKGFYFYDGIIKGVGSARSGNILGMETGYREYTGTEGSYKTSYPGKITYAVSFNANGGSGAPAAQIKTYGVNLTLSSTKPTRTGYTFLGWSTSSTATSATYAAGGTYTANAAATLYAVWKDTTPPKHGYFMDANTRYTNAQSGQTFRVHATGASDDESGVEAMYLWVRTGDSAWNILEAVKMIEWNNNGQRAWYYDVPISEEGRYLCHVNPRDNAGNWVYAGPSEYMIVDRTAPAHGYFMDANTRYTNAQSGQTFRVHATGASDSLSGVEAMYLWVRTIEGSWNKLSQVKMIEWNNNGQRAWYYDVPISEEGRYICHVNPRDNAGNWVWSGPYEFMIVDRTAPTVGGFSKSISNVTTSGATVRFNLTGCADNLSGVKDVQWFWYKNGSLVENPWRTEHSGTTWYRDVTISGAGTYIMDGILRDNASNTYNWSSNTSRNVFTIYCNNVSFNANGGSGGQSTSIVATNGAAMPGISTTAPTRAGYTFMGWYDNANYLSGTQYYTAAGTSARAWNKTTDTTLYAGWMETTNSYNIMYDGNGKTSGSTSMQNVEYNQAVELNENGYLKDEYAFNGWLQNKLYSRTLVINDSTEYTGSLAAGESGYTNIKQFSVNGPFKAGDVYRLEVDAKGSGSLVNYFYGQSGYLQVSNWVREPNFTTGTNVDGANTIPLTSDYQHYAVTFMLGNNGDGNLMKHILFRLYPGNSATLKNVTLYKIINEEEKINDTGEYSGTRAASESGYLDFKAYNVAGPFNAGDVYQLDVDIKGSGNLTNYFYGASGYLQVANWVNSEGRTGTNTDGSNTVALTSEYKHYTVKYTLGSTGDGSVTKTVLFRVGAGNSATIKNIKFKKVYECDTTEHSSSGTYNSAGYQDFVYYSIPGIFGVGDTYQLDVDVKGSGTLKNYFWSNESLTSVANWVNS